MVYYEFLVIDKILSLMKIRSTATRKEEALVNRKKIII